MLMQTAFSANIHEATILMTVRVHELARLAKSSTQQVLADLQRDGHSLKSASSSVPDDIAQKYLIARGFAERLTDSGVAMTRVETPATTHSWQSNPVRPPGHPDVLRNIDRVTQAFPAAARHLSMLQALGSQFVYADLRKQGESQAWAVVLVRFSGAVEAAFGLTREVAFFYFPFFDLQIRSFMAAKAWIEETKREITPDLVFLSAPDDRLLTKLQDWSNLRMTAVPLPHDMGDEPIAIITQLRDRVYARDLFYETAPVSGDRFFGRVTLLQELRDDIAHQRVSGLFGLRKSGKTSILHELRDSLRSESLLPVFVDLESLPSAPEDPTEEFVYEICMRLSEDLNSRAIRSNALTRAIASPTIRNFKAGLDHSLAKAEAKGVGVALMLDEIEFLTPADKLDIAEGPWGGIAQGLSVLRANAQSRSNFTFILAGLTNHILENGRLYGRPNPLFSWAKSRYVGPFARSEADDLARTVGSRMGVEIEDGALRALYDASGGHAYLYRNLASEVIKSLPIDTYRRVMRSADVLRALSGWRRSIAGNLEEIVNHLKSYYPEESILLEVLRDSPEQFSEYSAGEDLAVHHLTSLGLVHESRGRFTPAQILELQWA